MKENMKEKRISVLLAASLLMTACGTKQNSTDSTGTAAPAVTETVTATGSAETDTETQTEETFLSGTTTKKQGSTASQDTQTTEAAEPEQRSENPYPEELSGKEFQNDVYAQKAEEAMKRLCDAVNTHDLEKIKQAVFPARLLSSKSEFVQRQADDLASDFEGEPDETMAFIRLEGLYNARKYDLDEATDTALLLIAAAVFDDTGINFLKGDLSDADSRTVQDWLLKKTGYESEEAIDSAKQKAEDPVIFDYLLNFRVAGISYVFSADMTVEYRSGGETETETNGFLFYEMNDGSVYVYPDN